MFVKVAGQTDVGRNREANEDNFLISESVPLCIVADGMGGHSSGEVASAITCATIREFYEGDALGADLESELRKRVKWPFGRQPDHPEERRLVQSVLLANEIVHTQATTNPDCQGMGTTVVGAYFVPSGLFLIHVGDSRAYRYRQGHLDRITLDHSLADEYHHMSILTDEELQLFPYKNVVTRAIGLAEHVEPDVKFLTFQPDDIYLFCSDGLTDPLSDNEIRTLLRAHENDLQAACRSLIAAANEAGGPDNITVVLAKTVAPEAPVEDDDLPETQPTPAVVPPEAATTEPNAPSESEPESDGFDIDLSDIEDI